MGITQEVTTIHTTYRQSEMSEEEKEGFEHMFNMMMAAKQQILLRKAFRHELAR